MNQSAVGETDAETDAEHTSESTMADGSPWFGAGTGFIGTRAGGGTKTNQIDSAAARHPLMRNRHTAAKE